MASNSFFTPSHEQIVAFTDHYFGQTKRRKNIVLVCSPFNDDDKYHFGIDLDTTLCHDFRGDEWAGPPSKRTGKQNRFFVNFVCLYLNCSYREAVRVIKGFSSGSVPSLARNGIRPGQGLPNTQEEPSVALPGHSERLTESKSPTIAKMVLSWLRSRGVDESAVKRYDIHHDMMNVVWPYYEYETLVCWQARNITSKSFLFPDEEKTGISKGQFVYNFDQVEPARDIYVTESIFCCHTLVHQCVATGGAAMTSHQARKTRLLGPKDGVVLAPDNDAAGLQSIISNAKLLEQQGLRVLYSIPPLLEYGENGEKKFVKDWNEYVTGLKMPLADVWELMDKNISPYNMGARLKILTEVNKIKENKRGKLPLYTE